jgi:histidinol dehydrogenase
MSATIRRLDSRATGFLAELDRLLAFEQSTDEAIERTVAEVLARVRREGDAAVIEFTRRFDRLDVAAMAQLELPAAELAAAFAALPDAQRTALEAAAGRIRAYHQRQKLESWDYVEADGTRLGQQVTPLDRVGLYVPGGKAAYPSSVLMNALPAKVAGVGELIMVVPTPAGSETTWCSRPPIWPGSTGSSPSAAPRRWRPWPTAPRPFRRSTRSSGPAMPTLPRRNGGFSARSVSTWWRAPPRCW